MREIHHAQDAEDEGQSGGDQEHGGPGGQTIEYGEKHPLPSDAGWRFSRALSSDPSLDEDSPCA
jgi:hypothetical protein